MKYLKQIWSTKNLRNKILFTLAILLVYRVLTQISIPGANLQALQNIFDQNNVFGVFSTLTGGSIENFSIILMGVGPYINASIIMQLLAVIVPKIESLQKEGEQGRKVINKWTRILTVPLALLQSYGMILLLNSQSATPIIAGINDPTVIIPLMLTVTAGTILLMWLGELISEYGVGNGISLIIYVSIIAAIPTIVGQSLAIAQSDNAALFSFIIMVLLTLALTAFCAFITEGKRRIPITYAGQTPGKTDDSFLPIRVNQAGMIPILFAVSLVSFPNILGTLFVQSSNETLQTIGTNMNSIFVQNGFFYLLTYAFLIFAFTYFYVSITFNPEQVAENIQKRSGYIPGIRPGTQTVEYLERVSSRLNLYGGIFLAFVAILPIIVQNLMPTFGLATAPIIIEGASLIIMVSVIMQLVDQVNAQMVMHDYDKFY